MDAVAKRLHQLLVDALRERDPNASSLPVTVAEIYQELVPYRAVRERLGVELNADYEHALLRLLAGEDGLLRLEPASARDELSQELASPNPYVGIYRKFAACDVWVQIDPAQPQDGALESAGEETATPATGLEVGSAGAPNRPPQAASAPSPAPTVPGPQGGSTATPPVPQRTSTLTAARQRTDAGDPPACHFCSHPLPTGRAVRFCPYCGKDQRLRPCGRCGEALEQSWRYCIACGEPAATKAPPVPAGSRI